MLVYKFGGASIADAKRMENLLPIIGNGEKPLLMVISALGKTTNALEAIVNKACHGEKEEALALAQKLEKQHLDIALELLDQGSCYTQAAAVLNQYFDILCQTVKNISAAYYDYAYDQVVCMGEIFSTIILYYFLKKHHLPVEWIDIRKIIRTDDTFRDAVIDWDYTQNQAQNIIGKHLRENKIVITQGFIGATSDQRSVTLGREGSDYTAAVLAAMLHATSVTIWKDVEGLQNADPKQFPDTVKIDAISYNEVIEMAFYGAQIIHPKTIKPLQNHNIPLYVKCFLNPTLKGSVVRSEVHTGYPPLIVLKENQVLIQVTTKDFSFITEDNLSKLYSIFHNLKIKINLIQNAAISFVASIDNREDKIKTLIDALHADYKVTINENVHLLTVRHFTPGVMTALTTGKQLLLRQETRKTVQVIMK